MPLAADRFLPRASLGALLEVLRRRGYTVIGPTVHDGAIVYTPLETPLLAAAEARGIRTADGLGMLLHQAVPGFEKWFGKRPEVTDELHALIAADIEGR